MAGDRQGAQSTVTKSAAPYRLKGFEQVCLSVEYCLRKAKKSSWRYKIKEYLIDRIHVVDLTVLHRAVSEGKAMGD